MVSMDTPHTPAVKEHAADALNTPTAQGTMAKLNLEREAIERKFKDEIRWLTKENEYLKNQLASRKKEKLEVDLRTLQAEHEEWRTEIEQLRLENDDLRGRLDRRSETAGGIKSELEMAKAELESLKNQTAAARSKELVEVQRQLAGAQSKLARVEKSAEDATLKAKDWERQAAAALEEARAAHAKAAAVSEETKAMVQKVLEADAQATDAKEKLASAKSELEAMDQKIAELSAIAAEESAEKTEAQNIAQDQSIRLSALEQQLAACNSKLKIAEAANIALQKQRDTSKREMEETVAEMKDLQTNLHGMRNFAFRFTKSWGLVQEQVENVQGEMRIVKERARAAEAEAESLAKLSGMTSTTGMAMRDLLERTQRELNELQQEYSKMVFESAKAKAEQNEAVGMMLKMKGELRALQAVVSTAHGHHQELQGMDALADQDSVKSVPKNFNLP